MAAMPAEDIEMDACVRWSERISHTTKRGMGVRGTNLLTLYGMMAGRSQRPRSSNESHVGQGCLSAMSCPDGVRIEAPHTLPGRIEGPSRGVYRGGSLSCDGRHTHRGLQSICRSSCLARPTYPPLRRNAVRAARP
jgi:hypothetical protein